MNVLVEPKKIKINILGNQALKSNLKYRTFKYIKKIFVDNGLLLLNIMTYELLYLTNAEAKCFDDISNLNNTTVKALISKWFLVPEANDDLNLVKQLENAVCLTNKIYSTNKYNTFTILPTTDCNARCFYCFEQGTKKKHMSKDTAYGVAKFIINNKTDGKIYLRWFGGEPLYNSEAIDIICEQLCNSNIDFESHIITNGYLFDNEMIDKSLSLWKLKKVQITLDGTEEKYNRIKNYIYCDENAYLKVIDNIENLLSKNVFLKLRLNMDRHNEDDLYVLVNELLQRFEKYSNLIIAPRLLIDESCARIKSKNEIEREELVTKLSELESFIEAKGKRKISTKMYKNSTGHCMADSDLAILITPDGKLGKCESIVDGNFIGDIYHKELDFKMLNWYKEIKTLSDDCDSCNFRPCCVYPKCCINKIKHCTDFDKEIIDNRLTKQMLKCYEEHLNS